MTWSAILIAWAATTISLATLWNGQRTATVTLLKVQVAAMHDEIKSLTERCEKQEAELSRLRDHNVWLMDRLQTTDQRGRRYEQKP